MSIAIRFALLHLAGGFLLAGLVIAGLLLGNPGEIGTLLSQDAEGPMPLLLLWLFLGLTFGVAQLATASMLLEEEPMPQPVRLRHPRRR